MKKHVNTRHRAATKPPESFFIENKSGDERVVVGIADVSPTDVVGFEISAVKNMVDAEVESFLVVGDCGSESAVGVGVAEVIAAKSPVGMAAGCVVEVTANDDIVVFGEMTVDSLSQSAAFFSVTTKRGAEFYHQIGARLSDVAFGVTASQVEVSAFVVFGELDRVKMHVNDIDGIAADCHLIGLNSCAFFPEVDERNRLNGEF